MVKVKLSEKQAFWFSALANKQPLIFLEQGTYNPALRDERTFVALCDKGLVYWRQPNTGKFTIGGYTLTKAGRDYAADLFKESSPPSKGPGRTTGSHRHR